MGEIAINPIHNVHKKYRTMNFVNPYIFAPPVDLSTNTEIGGVASTISTPALLATKLGIDASRITNFAIVGSDIKCTITGSYSATTNYFYNDANITYFRDADGLVIAVAPSSMFQGNASEYCTVLDFKNLLALGTDSCRNSNYTHYWFKSATTIANNSFSANLFAKVIDIRNCTTLGSSSANNAVFEVSYGCRIYANSFLATNNGGSPDGDLTSAIAQGATVTYVLNNTAPNAVTDLSLNTVYNTSVKLNFTAPTGSINAIAFYEAWNGSEFLGQIIEKECFQLKQGISYTDFYIVARDIYYNASLKSNSISFSTTSSFTLLTGLKLFYGLDEESGIFAHNYFNKQFLRNIGCTVNQTGKIRKSYSASSAGQYLTQTKGVPYIAGNFTINLWAYRTSAPTATHAGLINFGDYASTGFGLWMNTSGDIAYRINGSFAYNAAANIPLNTWTMVSMVYNGSTIKVYVNSIEKTSVSFSTNPVAATFIKLFQGFSGATFIGSLDLVSVHNIALTPTEITTFYNGGTGITL